MISALKAVGRVDKNVKARCAAQRHVRKVHDRVHADLYANKVRIGSKAHSAARRAICKNRNAVVGRLCDVLGKTYKSLLIFIVVKTVYAKRLAANIVKRNAVLVKNAFYAKVFVDLGYTNVKEFGGIIDWPYEVVK